MGGLGFLALLALATTLSGCFRSHGLTGDEVSDPDRPDEGGGDAFVPDTRPDAGLQGLVDGQINQPDPIDDPDMDLIDSADDNCRFQRNPAQLDRDGDGIGDVCDDCPDDFENDMDGDGVCGPPVSIDAGMDSGMMSVDAGTDAAIADAGSDSGMADAGTDAGLPLFYDCQKVGADILISDELSGILNPSFAVGSRTLVGGATETILGIIYTQLRGGTRNISLRLANLSGPIGQAVELTTNENNADNAVVAWDGSNFHAAHRSRLTTNVNDGSAAIKYTLISTDLDGDEKPIIVASNTLSSTSVFFRNDPDIVCLDKNCFVGWQSNQSGTGNLWGVFVNGAGTLISPEFQVTDTTGGIAVISLALAGSNNILASSTDLKDGNLGIYTYMLRINDNQDGLVSNFFPAVSNRITKTSGFTGNPDSAWTGMEGSVVYRDNTDGDFNAFGAQLDNEGQPVDVNGNGDLDDEVQFTFSSDITADPKHVWSGFGLGTGYIDGPSTSPEAYFFLRSPEEERTSNVLRVRDLGAAGAARALEMRWLPDEQIFVVLYEDARSGRQAYMSKIQCTAE